MSLDILFDDLVSYIPTATAEVAASPKVPTPICFSEMRVLTEQFMGCLSFEPLHQTTDRYLRRNRDEKMDVILRDMTLDDVHAFVLADLSDYIPNSKRYGFIQNLLPVFRDPHQMKMYRENRM